MMKKVIKKLLAALLAVAMVCAMAIPAFAYNPGETEEDLNTKHDYGAFQIFTGDVSDDNTTISNVGWGESIPNHEDFLEKLKEDLTIGNQFSNAKTAQDVLMVISTWDDSDDDSIAFARFVCKYLYPTADAKPEPDDTGHTGGFEIRKPGYYLIVDISPFHEDDFYHAYNSFLLKVTKAPYHVIIKHKVVKPTVEKKVYDNDNNDISSAGGWGSSADHAINEKFQFQLIAKLPASKDNGRAYDYYDKYTVCFKDTLSEGITYDGPDSVVIKSNNNTHDTTIDPSKYTIDTKNLETQNYFEVNIPDVKACAKDAGFDLNDGATITFTYTAHLNEKAFVNTTSGSSTENKNSVQLKYSNNPRPGDYWGTTPKSEVYVYTYQLNNTKRQNTVDGPALAGAGFKLYSDEECKNEVGLYQEGEFYYPIKDATGKKAVEMISGENGQFNVKGLDAGTYYLKETITPAGYDTCGVTPVTIKADHSGNDHVNLEGSNLTIVNKKAGGITLPSTGGIGTTIFYVVGGGLMVAAIVLLVTKKRMENK